MSAWMIWAAAAAALLIAGVLVWLLCVVPTRTVRRGMELLASQETNNRLRLTGNPAADRVITLFNSLMERLHEQTLVNLRQNRLMSALVSASPMGVIIMDYDGRIADINPSALRLFGLEASETVGRRPEELPSELLRRMAALPKGKSTLRVSETEIYVCRSLDFIDKGFRRPFILIDNMAVELRRVEKEAYGKVIRTMAHEVNNTVGGLKALLDVMIESESSDTLLREAMESGAESCRRLGEFVDSYAEVARLPEPEKRPVALGPYISGLLPFLQSIAGGRAEVRLESAEANATVMADRGQLERVLVNIVKNAAEAMEEGRGGTVAIAISCSKGESRLTVTNDGRPIPEGVRESLFKPFFTTKPGGRGTGLALAGEILSRHGWRYTLATGVDGLTRFEIRIPPDFRG